MVEKDDGVENFVVIGGDSCTQSNIKKFGVRSFGRLDSFGKR